MYSMLYDDSDNLITDKIAESLITPQVIKITNSLLDGTYHIQSIGNAAKNISIACYVYEPGKAKIDNAYITDAHLKLMKDGKFYVGIIIKEPEWKLFLTGTEQKRIYLAKFTMNIQSEGVV